MEEELKQFPGDEDARRAECIRCLAEAQAIAAAGHESDGNELNFLGMYAYGNRGEFEQAKKAYRDEQAYAIANFRSEPSTPASVQAAGEARLAACRELLRRAWAFAKSTSDGARAADLIDEKRMKVVGSNFELAAISDRSDNSHAFTWISRARKYAEDSIGLAWQFAAMSLPDKAARILQEANSIFNDRNFESIVRSMAVDLKVLAARGLRNEGDRIAAAMNGSRINLNAGGEALKEWENDQGQHGQRLLNLADELFGPQARTDELARRRWIPGDR